MTNKIFKLKLNFFLISLVIISHSKANHCSDYGFMIDDLGKLYRNTSNDITECTKVDLTYKNISTLASNVFSLAPNTQHWDFTNNNINCCDLSTFFTLQQPTNNIISIAPGASAVFTQISNSGINEKTKNFIYLNCNLLDCCIENKECLNNENAVTCSATGSEISINNNNNNNNSNNNSYAINATLVKVCPRTTTNANNKNLWESKFSIWIGVITLVSGIAVLVLAIVIRMAYCKSNDNNDEKQKPYKSDAFLRAVSAIQSDTDLDNYYERYSNWDESNENINDSTYNIVRLPGWDKESSVSSSLEKIQQLNSDINSDVYFDDDDDDDDDYDDDGSDNDYENGGKGPNYKINKALMTSSRTGLV